MDLLTCSILLSILAGIVCLFIPGKVKGVAESISVIVSLATFILTAILFGRDFSNDLFLIDNLSRFVVLGIGLFGFLIVLYSLKYVPGIKTTL